MKQVSLTQECPWWSNKIISIKSQHLSTLKTILNDKIAEVLKVEVWWLSWGKAFVWLNCVLNYLRASLNIIFLEKMSKRQIMLSHTWAFGHLFLKCDGSVTSKENNWQYVWSSHCGLDRFLMKTFLRPVEMWQIESWLLYNEMYLPLKDMHYSVDQYFPNGQCKRLQNHACARDPLKVQDKWMDFNGVWKVQWYGFRFHIATTI